MVYIYVERTSTKLNVGIVQYIRRHKWSANSRLKFIHSAQTVHCHTYSTNSRLNSYIQCGHNKTLELLSLFDKGIIDLVCFFKFCFYTNSKHFPCYHAGFTYNIQNLSNALLQVCHVTMLSMLNQMQQIE